MIVVERVRLPVTSVAVTAKAPFGVCPPPLVKVSVDVSVPPEATDTVAGLNVALTPAGSVPAESVILPLKPFNDWLERLQEVDGVNASTRGV